MKQCRNSHKVQFSSRSITNVSLEEEEVLKLKKKNNTDLKDYEMIDNVIANNFLMRSLDTNSRYSSNYPRKQIIKEMSLYTVDAGTTIFKQGNIGFFFYILREGSVDLYINEIFVKTIKPNECFGELALLHNSPRTGTIKATKNCEFWVLERKNFRKIVEFINQINYEENRKFIQSIPILGNALDIILSFHRQRTKNNPLLKFQQGDL